MEELRSERYTTMAEVYDAWMQHDQVPYQAWAAHIVNLVREHMPGASRCLDLGCGTGQLLSRLMHAGFDGAGADASAEMIARAAERLPAGTPLFVRRMPIDPIVDLGPVDVVTACFDVLNYLVEPGEFPEAVAQVSQVLRPGGLFFFDLNTRFKLEKVFGNYNTGDDVGDFAYVWRNRFDVDTGILAAYVSFFVEGSDGLFRRSTEVHRERWFSPDDIKATLASNGFQVLEVSDGYRHESISQETLRQTWLARRVD